MGVDDRSRIAVGPRSRKTGAIVSSVKSSPVRIDTVRRRSNRDRQDALRQRLRELAGCARRPTADGAPTRRLARRCEAGCRPYRDKGRRCARQGEGASRPPSAAASARCDAISNGRWISSVRGPRRTAFRALAAGNRWTTLSCRTVFAAGQRDAFIAFWMYWASCAYQSASARSAIARSARAVAFFRTSSRLVPSISSSGASGTRADHPLPFRANSTST